MFAIVVPEAEEASISQLTHSSRVTVDNVYPKKCFSSQSDLMAFGIIVTDSFQLCKLG